MSPWHFVHMTMLYEDMEKGEHIANTSSLILHILQHPMDLTQKIVLKIKIT